MNRRTPPLIIGSLLLALGCAGNSPTSATLAISTTSLPKGAPGVAYSETLTATGGGGTQTWSITGGSLPIGLRLEPEGRIAGTPTVIETQSFTVRVATSDGQTATQQLSITVSALVLEPSQSCSSNPSSAIVTFVDVNLDAEIRSALDVGVQEALTCGQVSGLTMLEAPSAGITSVVGIQNLTSLTNLVLRGNSIRDIGSLSGLTSLTGLFLEGNAITDIGAVSDLTGLTQLHLPDNHTIADISALRRLTGLIVLDLANNSITDLEGVNDLTSLETLVVRENLITDISPLSGLTSLRGLNLNFGNSVTDVSALRLLVSLSSLGLYENQDLTDIQPLLDNTGLGAGDSVDLFGTNVSCADVATLQGKGITVGSDC